MGQRMTKLPSRFGAELPRAQPRSLGQDIAWGLRALKWPGGGFGVPISWSLLVKQTLGLLICLAGIAVAKPAERRPAFFILGLLIYTVGPFILGALLGLMRPLTQSLLGRILVGAILGGLGGPALMIIILQIAEWPEALFWFAGFGAAEGACLGIVTWITRWREPQSEEGSGGAS